MSLYAYNGGQFVRVDSLATGALPTQIVAGDLNGLGTPSAPAIPREAGIQGLRAVGRHPPYGLETGSACPKCAGAIHMEVNQNPRAAWRSMPLSRAAMALAASSPISNQSSPNARRLMRAELSCCLE